MTDDKSSIFIGDTGSEVSAIAMTDDKSSIFIGDMSGNILWTSIWDQ